MRNRKKTKNASDIEVVLLVHSLLHGLFSARTSSGVMGIVELVRQKIE